MKYITQIVYNGKHGNIQVVIFMDQVNILVGDIYSHKTHKTQFNKKVDHQLKDDDYRVIERRHHVHQSEVRSIFLQVTITDL